MRPIWFICGVLSLIIGVIGIPVPGLPTVPFLLLATFCFARSSARAHSWLVNHHKLGPPIVAWQKNGSIRRPAKIAASVTIVASFLISILISLPMGGLIIQALALSCVSIFIWSRPSE
ncbi:MAG: hypothetical protein CML33_03945 [Rhodobacteraceae bacterium]|nr:hypothetical protein [Paracoccaceae bacterium]